MKLFFKKMSSTDTNFVVLTDANFVDLDLTLVIDDEKDLLTIYINWSELLNKFNFTNGSNATDILKKEQDYIVFYLNALLEIFKYLNTNELDAITHMFNKDLLNSLNAVMQFVSYEWPSYPFKQFPAPLVAYFNYIINKLKIDAVKFANSTHAQLQAEYQRLVREALGEKVELSFTAFKRTSVEQNENNFLILTMTQTELKKKRTTVETNFFKPVFAGTVFVLAAVGLFSLLNR